MSSQILEIDSDTLTTYLLTAASNVQNVAPRAMQRGVFLDGGLRDAPGLPWSIAGNPGEGGCGGGPKFPCIGVPLEGEGCVGGGGSGGGLGPGGGGAASNWNGNTRICGDVRLDLGTYAPFDVDIAMPAPGFAWVVGRTYNARQELSASHHDSNGYQGRNWFQTSQPEIKRFNHPSDSSKDVVYLIYGADRFIEFKREGSSSNQFKAKNGAAGAMSFTAAAGGEPERYTYTDQRGNQTDFFGFDGNAGAAAGQFWRMTDPAGNVAYVGHASTGSSAISSGYDGGGRITLAFDTAGRRYTYTYSTLDGTVRLTRVTAEINDGGWVEVNRVDYGYYQTADTTYGEIGNLKLVTLTTPLTDSSKSMVRKKYYRYWKSADSNGTSYQVKMVVDFEGTRNFDWTGDSTFDDDFLTASHNDLVVYAAAYFEYSSRKISTATFNGQRACSGIATGEGTYDFTYGSNGSHSGGSGYDTDWLLRTEVELPDTTYLTQYFDEVGQPLGQVRTKLAPSQTSGQKTWATQVVRDSGGRITDLHSPANVSAYDHSTAAFTLRSSAGLVTTFTRQSSGDLTGFVTDVKHKTGTSGSAYLDLTLTYTTATKTITDSTVVRPFVASRRIYEDEITSGTTNSHLTSFAFTFHLNAGVLMPETITTTLPAVTTGKNGSNSSNTHSQYLNADGTPGFAKGPDGRIDYTEYSGGQLVKRIDDADTTKTGAGEDFNGITIPTGFSSSGTPLHRKTTFTYDRQGRTDVQNATASGGLVKKRNYSMLANRLQVVLSYNHFDEAASPDKFYGPVGYSIANHAGRTVYQSVIALSGNESTTAINSHVDTAESDVIDAVAALGTCHILSKAITNKTGTRVEEQRQYHSKPPVPGGGGPTGEGSEGTNYDTTSFAHDAMGRPIRTKQPHGTINRTNYDDLGRAVSQEVGTNDNGDPSGEPSGTNNMVVVSETEYDGGSDGGNSLVTKQTAYIQDSATGKRETTYAHDVRGRVLLVTHPAEPKHTLNKYDNLGHLLATAMYKTGTVAATDDPTSRSTDRLTLSRSYFDELGRVYKTTRHKINQSSGADDDSLESLTWYDADGRVIKVRGEEFAKTFYDRLGRVTHRFILANTNDSAYADADDVTGDVVLEEHQTIYDPSGSDVLMRVSIQRTHNDIDTGQTTGPLDTNADGDPMVVTAGNLKGRAQITAMWYDALHRLQDEVQYGDNGGSTFTRTSLSVPARSDTALRTTFTYDEMGRQETIEDPKARKTKLVFDDAGRQTKVIRNYDAGVNSGEPSGTDDNQTVEFGYTDGLKTSVTQRMTGSGNDQTTTYTFGTTKGTNPGESKIATGHLLQKVQYPDSSGGTDVVTHAYNAQGQMLWTKDQVGRVLEFDYDDAGRRLHERVTTSGGFDTAILRISTTYDTWGRVQLVTSWDNATAGSGTAKNEVKYAYDDWGNVSSFKQDRNGAVSGGGDEYTVSYTYAKKATGNGRYTIRRTQMTLPNGNVVKFTYQSSNGYLDDDASRVTRIRDGSDTNIVRYRYLGSGHVVGVLYNQPDVESKAYNGSDVYDALDRFNRLIISRWVKNPSTDRYKVTLSHDRNSNITDVDDSVQSGLDWQYTYDDLDRLTRARAGTLSGGSITSETRDQNWTLDHAGNWGNTTFDLNADDVYTGGGEYDWDFTQNKANEITGWDNQSNNVTPVYDAAGNMTDDQRDWQYEYDAWYRLVKVRAQNDDIVAEFKYNGLGHRISARYHETAPWYHFAYDERWRMVAMYEDDAATDVPTEQFWHHNAGPSGFGGSSYIDDVVLRDRDTDDSDGLDERVYYLQNWHHDVVALVDTSGTIIERANYDGYGMPIGTFSTNGNRRGYAGYEIDPELAGHWHVRHRVLRSDLGVWTRRDPAGYQTTANLLSVVAASPVNFVDPHGLKRIIATFDGQNAMGLVGPGTIRSRWMDWDERLGLKKEGDVVRHFDEDGDWFEAAANWVVGQFSEQACGLCDTVILIGHSHGGDAARKTAKHLNKRGAVFGPHKSYPVTLLFLFDPVGKPTHDPSWTQTVTSNVRRAIDWYQRRDPRSILWFKLQGYQIAPGENNLYTRPPCRGAHSHLLDFEIGADTDSTKAAALHSLDAAMDAVPIESKDCPK